MDFWWPDVHWRIFSHFLFSQDGRRLQAGFWGGRCGLCCDSDTHTHMSYPWPSGQRCVRSNLRTSPWQEQNTTYAVTADMARQYKAGDFVASHQMRGVEQGITHHFRVDFVDHQWVFLVQKSLSIHPARLCKRSWFTRSTLWRLPENVRDWVLSYIHIRPRYKGSWYFGLEPAETPPYIMWFRVRTISMTVLLVGTFIHLYDLLWKFVFGPDPIYW